MANLPGLGFKKSSTTPSYTANAVDFDGSTNYLLRGGDFTGDSDSTQGIFSCWFRIDGGNGARKGIFANNGNTIEILKFEDNTIYTQVTNSAISKYIILQSTTTYTAGSTWHNLLMSWDTNFSAGNKPMYMYIDNTSVLAGGGDTFSAFTVSYTTTDWGVGVTPSDLSQKFNGCMAEVYFAPGQYLDFSNSANRAKFISGGHPVDLGSDGSTPTGTAPILYLKGNAAGIATNSGTGGNMTANGSFSDCSTHP